jgi:hypothetical protein
MTSIKTLLQANRDSLVLLDRELQRAREVVPALALETLDTESFLPAFVDVTDQGDKRAGINLFSELRTDIGGNRVALPVEPAYGDAVVDSDATLIVTRMLAVVERWRFINDSDEFPVFAGFITPPPGLLSIRLVLNGKQVLTLAEGQRMSPQGQVIPADGFVDVSYFSPARTFDAGDFNATLPAEFPLGRNSALRVEVRGRYTQGGLDYYRRLHFLLAGYKVFG